MCIGRAAGTQGPQAGIVKELATTTLGAVVQPGTVLLSLVPVDEPLLAEVAIENQDIGFVQPGQSVRLKLAAYQFQKYGMLEGIVKTISADAQSASQDEATEQGSPGPLRSRHSSSCNNSGWRQMI